MKYIYTLLMLAFMVIATSTLAPTAAKANVSMTRECSGWVQTGNITVNWLTGEQLMQWKRLCCTGGHTMYCDYEYENRPLEQ